uniref:Uncharacterized protein n=1 Tax=Sphaerodactylus townsendi TaxID=933632 RepID=A0ACB8EGX7_9SAUR
MQRGMKVKHIKQNSYSFCYFTQGKPGAQPSILMLHGFLFNKDMWLESAAVPELQVDGVHADWCQEDQRQDEFLKELAEVAELADPKAIKVFQFQCQAVPEVEAKWLPSALPMCPTVQLSSVPAEQYPGDRGGGSCEEK